MHARRPGERGFLCWGGVRWGGGFLAALPLWNCSTDVRTHSEAAAKLDGRRDGDGSGNMFPSKDFPLHISLSFSLCLSLSFFPSALLPSTAD